MRKCIFQRQKILNTVNSITNLTVPFQIPDEVVDEVEQCNDQLRLRDGELLAILKKLATIMTDEEFVTELLDINDRVVQLSAGEK